MKRVNVGRFRVLLDDRGEGAVVIDHTRPEGASNPRACQLILEPGEVEDLIVALDAVHGDLLFPKDDERQVIHAAFQGALHEIFKRTLLHCRVEVHVNIEDFFRLVGQDAVRETRPGRRMEARFGSITLVCERGRRV